MIGKQSRICFAISLGILVVAIGMMVWGAPAIIRRQVQQNVQLEEKSMMFERWKKMPMPMDFKIYVFNVTNPDAVNKGAKPILQEIGPYVYKQYRERTVLGYGPNDTVKYTLKKSYFFDASASGELTEDDEVTVINFSYMAAILSVYDLLPSMVGTVNGALEQFFSNLTDPFLRVRVRDLFFDGIYLNCAGDHSALGLVCGKIKSEPPPTMRPAEDGTGFYFSMFSHLNRTEAGPFEMVRGRDDIYELGHIVSYKGKNSIRNWGDKYCGQLNGSDSSIFPPINGNNIQQRLYTFEPDICRSLYVSLAGQQTIFNMKSFYYEIDNTALAAKSANPDNRCFCKENWSANHDGCLIMGILNLKPCQGAPAIASFPHFYLASEELLEYFAGGIRPNKTKHNTYVYIDPVTGVVLKGVKRLQFNIELRNLPEVPQLEKVRTGLFPMLWIEEGAELTEALIEELQQSHTLMGHLRTMMWILLAVGIISVIGSAIAVVKSGALPIWQRKNTVSFILRPQAGSGNKVQ